MVIILEADISCQIYMDRGMQRGYILSSAQGFQPAHKSELQYLHNDAFKKVIDARPCHHCLY